MRIALFSFHYPPEKDSEGYVSAKLVNALTKLGHSVSVYKNDSFYNIQNNTVSKIFYSLIKFKEDIFQYKCFDLTQLSDLNDYVSKCLKKFKIDHTNKPFDIIVSRYEPIASSIAAYWAQRYSNLSWISSINDPFPRQVIPRKGLWKYWDMHRNKFQIDWANDLYQIPTRLVFPSEKLAEWSLNYINKNGIHIKKWDNKLTIIPHIGGPIKRIETIKHKNETVIIRHIGFLSKVRDVSSFIGALKLLDLDETLPAITVEFIGNNIGQAGNLSSGKIEGLRKTQVNILPEIENDEAFKRMAEADICLLVEEPGKISKFLPSKFCDYALAKTPILALTPEESVCRNYINRFGGGICVDPGNEVQIYESIKELIGKPINPCLLANEFSEDKISSMWQNILDHR